MPALGELGHVLTNQGVSGSYTTDTWTCTSVGATSVYSRNSTNNSIQYDFTNGWSDYGSDNPNVFRTQLGGIVTNPPADATVLYLYAANSLFAVLNTGYSAGSGGGTSTETLIETVDNTPVTGGTSAESFDPAAWLWDWYSVSNQANDLVRTTIVNLVGQSHSDFSAWYTDKVSGITSAITGAVIADNPDNSAEFVVTINLPEATIKDSIIFITDVPNDDVIGEVDFEPAAPPVVPPNLSGKVFRNFW